MTDHTHPQTSQTQTGQSHAGTHHPGEPRVEAVGEGCYAFIQPDGSWFINNTGFIASTDGVILIDTCATERRTRHFLTAVAETTPAPVRYLVNTHHHGDHTHGNYLTAPAAIIGTAACREALQREGISHYHGAFAPPGGQVHWGDLHLAVPEITFSGTLTLWAGDTEVQIIELGYQAHTTSDLLVWVPREKVLYTGDLIFHQGTPFALMGNIEGWLRATAQIRALAPEVLVPGHGPVCDRATGLRVLDEIDDYLLCVQSAAEEALRAGITPLDAAQAFDLGRFATLSDPERIVGNLHRAMHDLQGGDAVLGPLNLAAAVGDMLAYNGGQPLTCWA